MKKQGFLYTDLDDFLIEEEKKLNIIYKELLNNSKNKNSIKKFDRIIKSKLECRGLLPCSKSYEGESLLTLSKTWMVLILIKISNGKKQQEDFLTLVNSSLTHELNEYNEYKEFYEEQCELLFSDEEAITLINLHPNIMNKIDINISHEELKTYYIYLLYKPKYFQKINIDGLSKIKKFNKDEKKKKYDTKINYTSTYDLGSNSYSEYDEKGDRLDEKDMISKNRSRDNEISYTVRGKYKRKLNNYEKNKMTGIVNNRIKLAKKREEIRKTEKKPKKNIRLKSNYNSTESDDEEDEDISEDYKNAKKNKNKRKKYINDNKNKYINKKNKYFYEDEEETPKKSNKNKKNRKQKEREREREKSAKKYKNKKNKNKEDDKRKKESINNIFDLLGIKADDIEEKEEEEEDEEEKIYSKTSKSRRSISLPQLSKIKKENGKKTKDKGNNKNKKKPTEKKKVSGKKWNKTKNNKKSKSEDDYDSDYGDELMTSLNDLTSSNYGSNKYEDNLDKMNEKEKKEIEREIKAILGENGEELDIDAILEDSKIEGVSLSSFNSDSEPSDDIDIDI